MKQEEWHPGQAGRRYWRARSLNDLTVQHEKLQEIADHRRSEANLVSSNCGNNMHAPVLDLDHRAKLVASSTSGNHHLYIDELVTWRAYRALLRGFYRSGLIDASVFWRSLDREATYVRPPWVAKTQEEAARGSIDNAPDPTAARRSLARIRRRVLLRYPRWWAREIVCSFTSSHKQP